ncbi:MAG TPA: magnesium chelatase ATPase subunit I [Pyrinomonadaceae bacterium]|jgi:magnesium chelatase subunit D|nr:magnesium chelatase ATPase subunit I [Pyrinomonadaceae bacterium]
MTSRKRSPRKIESGKVDHAPSYPFTAIVGQDEMRLALLLSVIEPSIGGVLVMGHRGTGKSTAVRALAELLPPLTRVAGCPFNCDPDATDRLCDDCLATLTAGGKLRRERVRVPVVDLPLNATEDRVCGSLDIGRALGAGVRKFEPGLLARAHRAFLYIDEVNLLEDHLVDLLLDVAATGRNKVEREGVSAEHAARFVLVGSGNPEEGELRPQLLDRFGLCAEVRTPDSADERAEVVTRREAFDRDPASFAREAGEEQDRLRRRLVRARRAAAGVRVPPALVRSIAELCARLGTDGHRGELTIARAARALAAFEGRRIANEGDARRVAAMALRHRLRRDPFEDAGSGGQIESVADEVFGAHKVEDSRHTKSPRAPRQGDAGQGEGLNEREGRVEDSSAVNVGGDSQVAQPEATRGGGEDGANTQPAPAADSDAPSAPTGDIRQRVPGKSDARVSSRARGRASHSRGGGRGRFYGATTRERDEARAVAFGATLRAAAERGAGGGRPGGANPAVASEDVRYKLHSRKRGTLFIFAVDASGSMAVNRIRQAKGALGKLLRRSYVERDRVALVSFREGRGDLMLRPSRSPALAKRLLDALPVGGATPLAAGLARAHEIAARARREGAGRISLLVFTDGRANVPLGGASGERGAQLRLRLDREIAQLGAALRREGVESTVVDTRARFGGGEAGRALADSLGGSYTRLPLMPTSRL